MFALETSRPNRTPRRAGLSALVAAALMVLTGCGALQPGAAAVVGSATISHDTVERVARALCSASIGGAAAQNQPTPILPTSLQRRNALGLLIESEQSRLFGESEGAEPDNQLVSAALAQNEPGLAVLPEDQRGSFRETLKAYAVGQSLLIEIGHQSLAEQGRGEVPDQEALAEGQRLRAEWAETIDIEVDPRYGTFADGGLQPGGSELSVPTSEDAQAAMQAEPPPAWAQTLPASQKCS